MAGIPTSLSSSRASSVRALPDERARTAPLAPCLADAAADEALDNVAFLERVRRASALLRRYGIGEGDVVALALPNSAELVACVFGAWRVGAVVSLLNPSLTEAEMQFQIDDALARVVIGSGLGVEATTIDPEALAAEPPDDEPAAYVAADALALLVYTSGTTGKPKGVMLEHGSVDAMCTTGCATFGVDADDHSLLVLPLFHVNGLVVGVLAPLLAGARVTMAPRFEPGAFLDLIEDVRPTLFSAVPAIYAMLGELPEAASADTSSLRLVICGAAPMPAELIRRFEERFGVVVVEGYGLTEATCASAVNPYDGVCKPGTVGLPMTGQEIRLAGADGPGVRGEVLIKGPTVMRGYLGRPEATAAAIRDGWLHTGDVGVFDEDGYLTIVDRITDLVIRGGENVYPKEIESVLYAEEGVLEAAVIGRADARLGEIVVAYVVRRAGAGVTTEDLAAICEAQLAQYKRPAAIELVAELPKNAVGKVDKPALRLLDAARR